MTVSMLCTLWLLQRLGYRRCYGWLLVLLGLGGLTCVATWFILRRQATSGPVGADAAEGCTELEGVPKVGVDCPY